MVGAPRNNMRVMSLQYPFSIAPISTTTSSPRFRGAAVGWSCGRAERRPPATMVSKLGFSAPRRRMVFQFLRQVLFLHARADALDGQFKCPRIGFDRAEDAVDFRGRLHHAQLFDPA